MSPSSPRLALAPRKERSIQQGHHWIYSGAVQHLSPEVVDGDLVEVFSSTGEKLGLAFFNEGHSIRAHMIAFGKESLEEALRRRIEKAIALRQKLFDPAETNAFRLLHAEGDGVPGVIVDSYGGVLVMQISHPGMEKIKPLLTSLLLEAFQPRALYEKSTSYLRKKEGMEEIRSHLYGEECPEVEILENGLRFSVDLLQGQKTGFFLDQREMRKWVRELSSHRSVLNCFAYTGGFSVAALAGGARFVESVEISPRCEERVKKNLLLNKLHLEKHHFYCGDVLDFLKCSEWPYDLVILDPPAFAKKRKDVPIAFRAYKEMNQSVLEKMAPGTFLLTCSCSYHIEEALFQNLLFRAARSAGRKVQIVGRHRQALDHPVSLFHPESSYLKSFLLFVS